MEGGSRVSDVTITDVAARVGVSVATISRYLSGFNVRQKSEIESAIQELNYRPSAAARNLKSGRTGTIAIVVPDISNPFFSSIATGAEGAAGKDHMVMLLNTSASREREERVLGQLFGRVDGVILAPLQEDDEGPSFFSKFGLPIVFVDRITEDYEKFDSVLVDNVKGARLATEHLIALGHKKIATIVGPLNTTPGKLRAEGYKTTLRKRGIELHKRYLVESDFTREGGYASMVKLLQESTPPTAVITGNNLMTIGALEALKDNGVRIPEDISIIGFDDLEFSTLIEPSLTAIYRDFEAQGAEAMRILLARLTHNQSAISNAELSPQHSMVDVHLIERGSCAPPKELSTAVPARARAVAKSKS